VKNIVICNFKGGTGKSAIAHQLITGYNFSGIEIDPYGSLADRLPEKVLKDDLESNELMHNSSDTVFDFGGFDSPKLDIAINQSDLILVPFIPTLESVQTTLDTLLRIKDFNKPILLVSNQAQKPKDIEDAQNVFVENLGVELELVAIPYSIGLQTAINENTSVKKLAEQKGLQGFMYRKIAESFDNLYLIINSYLKRN
jgi:cellulose biosynthesis protein BcsQ